MDEAVAHIILGCRCKCCEAKYQKPQQPASSSPRRSGGFAADTGSWPDIPDPVFVGSTPSFWSPQLPRSLGETAFIPETVWEQVEPLPAPKTPRHKGVSGAPGPGGAPLHTIVDDLGQPHGDMSTWQTVDHSVGKRVCRNRIQQFAYAEDRDLIEAMTKQTGPLDPQTPWAPWDLYRMRYPQIFGTVTKVLQEFNYAQLLQAIDDQLHYETGEVDQNYETMSSTPICVGKLVEIALVDNQGPYRIELKKSTVDISGDAGVVDNWIVYRVVESRHSQDHGWQEVNPISGWGQPVTKNGALEDRAGASAAIYPLGRLGSDQSQYPDNVVITGPLVVITTIANAEAGQIVGTGILTSARLQYAAVSELGLPENPPPLEPQPQLIYRNLKVFVNPEKYAVIGGRTVGLAGNNGWEALEQPDGKTALLLWLDAEYQLHVESAEGGHTVTVEELKALTGTDQSIISLSGTPAFHTPARRAYLTRFDGTTCVLAAWHPWRDAKPTEWSKIKVKRPKTWTDWIAHRNANEPVPQPQGLPLVMADMMPGGA